MLHQILYPPPRIRSLSSLVPFFSKHASKSFITAWQYESPSRPFNVDFFKRPSSRFPLGAHDGGVVGRVGEGGVRAVVQEAVSPAAIADEEECGQEHQGTDGAGLTLQEEAEQVEAHEHAVVEPEGRVERLGDEQHWEQPLEAVHGGAVRGDERHLLDVDEKTGWLSEQQRGGLGQVIIPDEMCACSP